MNIRIEHLSEAELHELNHRIVERLKLLRQVKTVNAMINLHLGQRVCFDPDGRVRTGTVVKFNQKTVVVVTDDHHQWKVPPHALKPLIEEPGDAPKGKIQGR